MQNNRITARNATHNATMKQNVGGVRLKLGAALDSQLRPAVPREGPEPSQTGAAALAKTIAAHTVKVLLEGEMLDPTSASEELLKYGISLDNGLNVGQCILRFLFPDDGRLAMVLGWLNSQANLHVWEIAHRIPPPELFYKVHPEIFEACKLCGTVILDAATPSTITTGSINPLTGEFLARWIQTQLEYDPGETHPRFFFHVAIPPRLWSGIIRSHFRLDHAL
jgi:hypothetical protein